jgi:mRNA-degrading endonuclease RelE of RelBE toxin-antitoxin system
VALEVFLSERFRAIVRRHPKSVRREIGKVIDRLQASFGDPHRHAGMGLRKLAKSYFEVRVGLRLRLVLRWDSNAIVFVFAGTHDEVQRFLRQSL